MPKKIVALMIACIAWIGFAHAIEPEDGPWPVELLKDIATSDIGDFANPQNLVKGDGMFFFTVTYPGVGRELWKSDGTTSGTMQVKEILPGHLGSDPENLTYFQGKLYFTAIDHEHGRELWSSDGTPEGTQIVRDLTPGKDGSDFDWIAATESYLLISAQADSEFKLWRSDGTHDGTSPVISVETRSQYSVASGRVYFNDSGDRIWCSDGTTEGTAIFMNQSGVPAFIAADDQLFFLQRNDDFNIELWRTDGTQSGAIKLAEVQSVDSAYWTLFNSVLYFPANDGVHGSELWSSDGTISGTILHDLLPGEASSRARSLTEFEGKLYVPARNHIYVFDHDRAYQSIPSQASLYWPRLASVLPSGKILFLDVQHVHSFDVSTDVIELLATPTLRPDSVVALGDYAFFAGSYSGIWSTDGSQQGTSETLTLAPYSSSYPNQLTDLNGQLVFSSNSNLRDIVLRVWKSDGTTDGTNLVSEVDSDFTVRAYPNLLPPWMVFDDRVYFSPHTRSGHWIELWATDGTNEGTVLVKPFDRSRVWTSPENFLILDGELYFTTGGLENLWKTDGTTTGTTVLATSSGYSRIRDFFTLNDELYMSPGADMEWRRIAKDGTELPFELSGVVENLAPFMGGFIQTMSVDAPTVLGEEVHLSDGTLSGTVLLKDIAKDSDSPFDIYNRPDFTPLGNLMFFLADDHIHGRELWVTDGTTDGTVLVKDIAPGITPSEATDFTPVGDLLYFLADDSIHGAELWRSDGTEAGTFMLADIGPGDLPAYADNLREVDGKLAFTAYQADSGSEMWISGGTPETTRLVVDVVPGPIGSAPMSYTRSGDYLYFAATDIPNAIGTELYAVPLERIMDEAPPVPRMVQTAESSRLTTIDLDFGEEVRTLRDYEVEVTNGIVTDFQDLGSGNYSFTIQRTADAEVTVVIPAGVVRDYGANLNPASEPLRIEYDPADYPGAWILR